MSDSTSPSFNLLIINPNSSSSITAALSASLSPHCPPNVTLTFFNPSTGPKGISDPITAEQSTQACLSELTGPDPTHPIDKYDGVLVCCFSDHPLIWRLKEYITEIQGKTTVLGMFHAGLSRAMLISKAPFGILATGSGYKSNHYISVEDFLGTKESSRFVGSITSNLQVVELQEGDQTKVEKGMKDTTITLVEKGAETIILGCAGMCGMDQWVIDAALSGTGKKVTVIDGARTGVELLVAMIRCSL
ncbi:uncharacterized protein IL334_006203 [Kwoniella shivajii]|uniref:Protein DCG1 n=1 Tax=Kwoniella shivajii TaxID=564305 RepID=A0ABZ1D5A7_9TREE|nr:hypothetical protein IL334_006203 [Kwoniella shivajii]